MIQQYQIYEYDFSIVYLVGLVEHWLHKLRTWLPDMAPSDICLFPKLNYHFEEDVLSQLKVYNKVDWSMHGIVFKTMKTTLNANKKKQFWKTILGRGRISHAFRIILAKLFCAIPISGYGKKWSRCPPYAF